MAATNGFPRDLLTQSATARRNYFRDCTIAHPHLAEVYRRLRTEIATVEPGTLLFVYGPSGIGKTTLLQRLAQKVAEEMGAALVDDVSRIPLVTVEALSIGRISTAGCCSNSTNHVWTASSFPGCKPPSMTNRNNSCWAAVPPARSIAIRRSRSCAIAVPWRSALMKHNTWRTLLQGGGCSRSWIASNLFPT
jgi:hypothetical protein